MQHGEIAVNIQGPIGSWVIECGSSPPMAARDGGGLLVKICSPDNPVCRVVNFWHRGEIRAVAARTAVKIRRASGFFWTLTIDGDEAGPCS